MTIELNPQANPVNGLELVIKQLLSMRFRRLRLLFATTFLRVRLHSRHAPLASRPTSKPGRPLKKLNYITK